MLLSLCMIVKNEENNLKRCLDSVKDIVDEMIIVDTGSTDSTVKIAESYGAKVFFMDWNDNFSDARNYSLEQAEGDWILLMDADDQLDIDDKYKVISLLDDPDMDICLFQTLSYVGNKPGFETVSNLNVRLIKNHTGYRFEGAIHEQITSAYGKIEKSKVKIEQIKIYHYGYLKSMYLDKNKPERNMDILNKLLDDDPDNSFHLFNMGNEYLRLKKYHKAHEYYKKSFKNFNPYAAHSSKLLLRMSIVLDKLNMFDDEIKMIDIGLQYYPNFTDLEYLRADLFYRQKKYSLAIKGLKKCLTMGEVPLHLSLINDVGCFKPNLTLAEIYSELGDYEEAYTHYMDALKAKPTYYQLIYKIAELFSKQKKEVHFIKTSLERFFHKKKDSSAYIILGDIFFGQKKYDTALDYFMKAETLCRESPRLYYYIGISYLYLKNYHDAYRYFEKIKEGFYFEKAIYKMILCEIITDHYNNAENLLDIVRNNKSTQSTRVYEALKNLMKDTDIAPLSTDIKESEQYLAIMIHLLDILLNVSTPEIFEKALHLLNLIESDEVLLKLAKLYYNNGYYQLAYQEFIRSIKMFDKIDSEGLEMMSKIRNE